MKVNIIKSLKYHNQQRDLSMRHFLILILSITALTMTTNNNNAEAKMFNKFKKGFYFEKYDTSEKSKTIKEAQKGLLTFHPIGSKSKDLFETLIKAGAEFKFSINRKELLSDPIREKEYFSKDISESASVMYEYQYNTGIWIINPVTWSILIFCDNNNLITNLYINRDYMGL